MKTLILFCLLNATLSWAQEKKITLYYNDRPPYLVSLPDGSAAGLTGTAAANAFLAADISFQWEKLPTNRQLAAIRENTGAHCAVGWFKNPEREHFAKFSKAIYRDKPTVILAHRQFLIGGKTGIETVLARKDVRVLVKDGFSYGPFIDQLLAKLKPNTFVTTGENSQMVQMIKAHRADFMFVAEEEANYFVEQAGLHIADFHLLRFPDMPSGEKRYIMCSRQVSDYIIAKLNKSIAFE